MNKTYVDSDVILDFMFAREPFASDAEKLFSMSEKKEVALCTSGLVFANVYYVLRKLAPHKKVIEKLGQLIVFVDIIDLPKVAVINALRSDFNDFEDALQYFSAFDASVKIIVTRNTRDYKHSELAVLTPDQYLKGRN